MRGRLCAGVLLAAVAVCLPGSAQEGQLRSGPPVGDLLPGSFHPFNLNGKTGKGRYHCLVCEFRLDPVVMVFAREHPDGKNEELTDLLTKLDEAVARHRDAALKSFVVFLSPDARSSVTEPKGDKDDKLTEDEAGRKKLANELVEEEAAREKLTERLSGLAKKLNHVVVSYFPAAGPEKYKIDPKADVTVIVYHKHRVVANYAYPEGGLTAAEVGRILKGVEALVVRGKKKAAAQD